MLNSKRFYFAQCCYESETTNMKYKSYILLH